MAIGLAFSSVAFTDGILFGDPYPGYGEVESRVRAAHETYIGRKRELIESFTRYGTRRVRHCKTQTAIFPFAGVSTTASLKGGLGFFASSTSTRST